MTRYALGILVFTFFVITLGALTRLLDAGLGCPDWPVCYGHWVPAKDVSHTVFSLWEYDQGKAWMEMIHRYGASLLGLLIFIQGILLWRAQVNKYLKAVALFLCAWVVVQGLFGMWTVTLRLWPPVVSGHLLGGAITLLCQFVIWRWLILHSHNQSRIQTHQQQSCDTIRPYMNKAWLAFVVVVFLQMALGAWTSSQYAGLACPDFPTCQGRWWVEIDSGVLHAPRVEGAEYLGGVQTMKQRMAVQWLHRLGALVVLLTFIGLIVKRESKPMLWLAGSLLTVQIVLGILNAVWLLPLSLALLHNSFAMLLLLASAQGVMASSPNAHRRQFNASQSGVSETTSLTQPTV